MSDEGEVVSYIHSLPPEILLKIFVQLPAINLIKCREVCVRWSLIIDGMALSHDLWYRYCKEDFSDLYKTARRKAKPGILWYSLYRSLALWRRLTVSIEDTDEFSAASSTEEEIRNLEILDHGILGVHKKSSIVYYDIDTLRKSQQGMITGEYSRYTENDKVIIIQSYHMHCFLIRKEMFNDCDTDAECNNVTFDSVKLYTLTEDALYYVNLDDEIHVCYYTEKELCNIYLKQSEEGIMSIGFSDGNLNILTFQRDIYTIVENNLVFRCTLGQNSNLLHQLQKFNFLEQLDWRVYFQWMYVLNHSVPHGPLRDIIIIRQYGDIFFVGSNSGVLRIYYAPYSDGELDIFNTPPIKQYNFMERYDCPVLSMCPILQVDIMEVEDGHTVFVAMPKKIAVLNFTHTFKRTASVAMLPYDDTQKVKSMRVECK